MRGRSEHITSKEANPSAVAQNEPRLVYVPRLEGESALVHGRDRVSVGAPSVFACVGDGVGVVARPPSSAEGESAAHTQDCSSSSTDRRSKLRACFHHA
eukprot:365554-Chlamydomonas_euryale.AAC.3